MGILISHPRHSAQMAKQTDHLWEGIDASNIHLAIFGDNASTSCFAIRQPVGKERGKERRDRSLQKHSGRSVCLCRARTWRLSHQEGTEGRNRSDMRVEVVCTSNEFESKMAIKAKAKAFRSTYLDIGLRHIGRLDKLVNVE